MEKSTEANSWLAWRYPSTDLNLQKTDWLEPDEILRFMKRHALDSLVKDVQGTIVYRNKK